jgi:UDP-N-acetylglucosamine diphosphorylase/glucosamine-1-phosphate N-acetyltransferase
VGLLTLAEKWKARMEGTFSYHTAAYLSGKFPLHIADDNLVIHGGIIPDEGIVQAITKLPALSKLENEKTVLAARIGAEAVTPPGEPIRWEGLKSVFYRNPVRTIRKPWDIFLENGAEIIRDFILVTAGKESGSMPDPFSRIYNERNIFISPGVSIRASILNAENGPIFLGKDVSIQEGAMLRGPVAVLEGSEISMGAKIRENTTIGPFCKVGGEVKNSVITGYSNKAHDGYLGNSVIGEWCNLGADTNCSNLKNNYSAVRVWDYLAADYVDSHQQFCGTFIGDHTKTSIGTMINTGTVMGVSANVFGPGLTPKFIPSFTWGGVLEKQIYDVNRAIPDAGKMMSRRNMILSPEDSGILEYLYRTIHKTEYTRK